jgi:hypothetical protein
VKLLAKIEKHEVIIEWNTFSLEPVLKIILQYYEKALKSAMYPE